MKHVMAGVLAVWSLVGCKDGAGETSMNATATQGSTGSTGSTASTGSGTTQDDTGTMSGTGTTTGSTGEPTTGSTGTPTTGVGTDPTTSIGSTSTTDAGTDSTTTSGSTSTTDSTTGGKLCGWDPNNSFYDCGFEGADPRGIFPYECPPGLNEGQPCGEAGLTGEGCCDANGDNWYCSQERVVFLNSCG